MIFLVQRKLNTLAVTLRGRTRAEVDTAVEFLVNIPMRAPADKVPDNCDDPHNRFSRRTSKQERLQFEIKRYKGWYTFSTVSKHNDFTTLMN
jgi:hypothetical protein